jgi:ribosomal protein L31
VDVFYYKNRSPGNSLREDLLEMRQDIHPTYYPEAEVICACGNTWHTGSTKKVIHTDVCSKCHPFYTGEQRIVDTEGQVDRFYKKLQARQQYLDDIEARDAARTSMDRPIAELDLGTRPTEALASAGKTGNWRSDSFSDRRIWPEVPGRFEETAAPVRVRTARSGRGNYCLSRFG